MSENTPNQPSMRPANIEPFDESLLSAFLDDELAAPERAKVLQRLAVDPNAKETLESMREMRGLVSSLPGWTGPLPSVDYTSTSDFNSGSTDSIDDFTEQVVDASEQGEASTLQPLDRSKNDDVANVQATEPSEDAALSPGTGGGQVVGSAPHAASFAIPAVAPDDEIEQQSASDSVAPVAEEPVAEEPVAPVLRLQHSFTPDSPDVVLATDEPTSSKEPAIILDTSSPIVPDAPIDESNDNESALSPASLTSGALEHVADPSGPESSESDLQFPSNETVAETHSAESAIVGQIESEDMKDNDQDASLGQPDDAGQTDEALGAFEQVDPLTELVADDADVATDDEVEQFIEAHRNAALSSGWNFGTTARVLGLAATLILAALGGYMFWPASSADTLANRTAETSGVEELGQNQAVDDQADADQLPIPQASGAPSADEQLDSLTDFGDTLASKDPLQAELNAALGANRSLPSAAPRGLQQGRALPRASSAAMPSLPDGQAYAGESQSLAEPELPPAAPASEPRTSGGDMLALAPPTGSDVSSSLPPPLTDATPFGAGALNSTSTGPPLPNVQPESATPSDVAMSLPDQNNIALSQPKQNTRQEAALSFAPAPTASGDMSSSAMADSVPIEPEPTSAAEDLAAEDPAGAKAVPGLPNITDLPPGPAPSPEPSNSPAVGGPAMPSVQSQARPALSDIQTDTNPKRKSFDPDPTLSRQEIDQLLPEPAERPKGTDALIDGKHFVFYSDAWKSDELPGAVESIAPLIGYGRPRLPKQIVAPIGSLELRGEEADSVAVEISRALPKATLAQRPTKASSSDSQMLIAFVSDVEADAVVRALSVQRRQRLSAAWLRPTNTGDSEKAILVLRGLTKAPSQPADESQ